MDGLLHQVVQRLRAHWRLKLALSLILPVAFEVLYFSAQRFYFGVVRPAPRLACDAWIPFQPDAIYLYESLWLLQAVAPWLLTSRRELKSYVGALALITAVGLIIFLCWPTSSPRPVCPASANGLYRGLIRFDNELNAFPSLHAAFAVFNALLCGVVLTGLRGRNAALLLIWLWTFGILAATLLTKQHVVADILAGTVLAGGAYAFYLHQVQALTASPVPDREP